MKKKKNLGVPKNTKERKKERKKERRRHGATFFLIFSTAAMAASLDSLLL